MIVVKRGQLKELKKKEREEKKSQKDQEYERAIKQAIKRATTVPNKSIDRQHYKRLREH